LILEDIVPAQEVIPFLAKNKKSFLHAGPPVDFDRMCNAMKGSAVGMIMLEGWASGPEDALKMMKSGIIWIILLSIEVFYISSALSFLDFFILIFIRRNCMGS
jgi:hypothetical protein